MPPLEIFFDYICPFCRRAHGYLLDLAKKQPLPEIVWRPCEAHPRPEPAHRHSDLAIRGFFYAQSVNADLWKYHELMYAAVHERNDDIEDIAVLSGIVDGLLDPEKFAAALNAGRFKKELAAANDYAYEKSGVWFLPAYRTGGRRLSSAAGLGVTPQQIENFITS